MKKTICICAFLFIASSGFAQVVDTAAVVREVDSLIKLSQKLTKQAEYEKALEINTGVEVLASGKLGRESAAYGKACYNRGLILFYKGNYREAENWYLESATIRQKILGEEHIDYAESLNSLAIVYYYLDKFEKAEPLYLKAIAIQEKVLGKEHSGYARNLNNLANLYMSMGNHEAAERLMLESRDIKVKVLGKEHYEVGVALLNLGNLYFHMRVYEKAELLLLESKTILEKALGKEHAYYAQNLNVLASTYQGLLKYEAAEPLYLEALNIREKKSGKEHADYAWNLYNLVFLYNRQGKYNKSIPLLLECLAIRKRVLGTDHQDYLTIVTTLGGVYQIMGQYELAESLFLESITLWEKKVGKDDPKYAAALSNLASLYFNLGNFQDAESLFLQIKSIRKKALGSNHPDYAESLNSLGVFYNRIGEFKKAEYFLLEASSIQDSLLVNKYYGSVNTMHNLAILYKNTNEFVKSEAIFREVLMLHEEQRDTSTPSYAGVLINLATLYKKMNKYEEAEILFLKARDIFENQQENREHVFYLVGLAHLADLYAQRYDYDKAEQIFLEVLSLREKEIGTYHPDYSACLNHLGLLYWKTGKATSAAKYFGKDVDLVKSLVSAAARHLSQQEMTTYTQTFQISFDQYFSFLQAHLNVAAGSTDVCFNNILFYKGFLLNAADKIRSQPVADNRSNETFNLLKSTNRLLAAEYAKPVSQRGNVRELEEQANALEKELTKTVSGFGDALRQVNWQEVQSALRPGEAAIEFIHFKYYNPESTDSILYAALLLKPGMQHPEFIPLCEEKQLKALLPATDGKLNNDQVNELYSNTELYRLLWLPIELQLSDVQSVYYSPSGLLHRLNLAALPTSLNAVLSDRHDMVSLGSTRQLALDNQNVASNEVSTALIYGGIQFDMDGTEYREQPASHTNSQRGLSFVQTDSTLRGGTWDFLKWSEKEADNVQAALGQAGIKTQVVKGQGATEESFKQIGQTSPSPRILHISTHGFFFPDPANLQSESRNLQLEEPVFKLSDHPMIRSGLILAGANHAWKTGLPLGNREDGILTAYEISQLDLRNTELVVLSACETGLGHIEGNEGVYGLQRAFKIAGAKTLIMSLWQVPDYQTQELMTAFYQKWLSGKLPVRQALQAAQKEMRDKGYEPYYWAGFVLVE